MKTNTTKTTTWLRWKIFQLLMALNVNVLVIHVSVAIVARSNSPLPTTSWLSNQTSLEECLMKFQPVGVCPVDSSSVAITKMWGTQVSKSQLWLSQSCLWLCCSLRFTLVGRFMEGWFGCLLPFELKCSSGCTIRTEWLVCRLIFSVPFPTSAADNSKLEISASWTWWLTMHVILCE